MNTTGSGEPIDTVAKDRRIAELEAENERLTRVIAARVSVGEPETEQVTAEQVMTAIGQLIDAAGDVLSRVPNLPNGLADDLVMAIDAGICAPPLFRQAPGGE